MAAAVTAVAVLLRRLQARPGAPGDDGDVLGRCEGGALSAALDLGARLDAPVIAVAVGPARREDRVLAMALRAGCARGLRIDDSQIGEVDYFGLAQVLAAAIRHVGARLVVCGDRSQDEGAGAVGPAVAELLEWSHLTAVHKVLVEGDHLIAVRRADGVRQRFRMQPPAVLCVEAAPVTPLPVVVVEARASDESDTEDARPPGRGKPRKRARTPAPTIDELDLADLGVDPRAIAPRRTSAGRLRAVRSRGMPTLASSADDLVARLRADRLLLPSGRKP